MILDKYVEIPVGSRNKKHYLDLGYDIYQKDDGKKYFNVMVKDLQHSTATKVLVSCDNEKCDNTWMQPYKNYVNIIKRYGTCYCHDCQYLHNQETCLTKYGETSYTKTQECKDKHVETYLKRFGVSSPMLSNDIRKKVADTNLIKYGSKSPFGNNDVRAKSEQSLIKKYGSMDNFYNYFHSASHETMKEKYGYENATSVPEIREKIAQSFYKNSSQSTSSQQLYIHRLFGGELNYPFKSFSLDIYKTEDNIVVEVDFGGHDLGVKTGRLTQQEFANREMIREKMIRSNNMRLIRLISPHDKMPTDEKLLELYDFAKNYFNSTNHTWINFYIEENKYRNAEHIELEGSFFDYGELWNAKVLSRRLKEVNDVV